MDVAAFDYELPPELIAHVPPAERGASRLLVMDRATGRVEHRRFGDLAELLVAGDLLVLNDTRVFPARLLGRRLPGRGRAECLLLERLEDAGREAVWRALVHPGQRLREGSHMVFEDAAGRPLLHAEVVARHFHGQRTVRLWALDGRLVDEVVDQVGHVPLPPYIRRPDTADDRERYQTVYARARGSVAAPTAGLHFTPALFDALERRGVTRVTVTLHVGYGTFEPVRTARVEAHHMHAERFEVTPEAAAAISAARRARRRVIAVGTTSTRVLESLEVTPAGDVLPACGETALFIHPGHEFRLVGGLITNFHLPRSSLLMLVAAFGGLEPVLAAYREAVAQRYRFYSYGDAMAVL